MPEVPAKATINLFARGERGRKIRDQRTRRLMRAYTARCDWLQDTDRDLLRRFCQLSILCDEMFAVMNIVGAVDEQQRPRELADTMRRLALAQARIGEQLGLTPRGRQELQANGRRAPFDLAAQLMRDDFDADGKPQN